MKIFSRNVVRAESKDIPGMLSVLEQNLFSNKKNISPEKLENTGFLLRPFSAEEAQLAIEDTENYMVGVSRENDAIIGYIMGCDSKTLSKEFQQELSETSPTIKNILASEKVFYLRHIAKSLDKKNVGHDLLQFLINQVLQADYKYIICIIAESPLQNKTSKKFHEKNGFVCLSFYKSKEGKFGVYLKKL